MLFSLGHGQRIVVTPPEGGIEAPPAPETEDGRLKAPAIPLGRVTGAVPPEGGVEAPAGVPGGPFAFLFPDAPGPSHDEHVVGRLGALASAMIEQGAQATDGALDSRIPPVFTYFGQFIDHDITANTDRETASSRIDGDLAPLPRDQVRSEVRNLRNGSLGGDSFYGGGPAQDAFSKKLEGLMRHPRFRAKMRLGTATDVGNRPPLPADPAVDVLRLGRLIEEGSVTEAELRGLPPELAAGFLDADGRPLAKKAIIGDGRNDENLVVAQLQVAFLRLHNKIADWVAGRPDAPAGADALFARARELTLWHYQWLVVNAFLPAVCDPKVVARVVAEEAPLYRAFFERNRGPQAERMPMPLEFSVAAFRYGHSMVRAEYDHNRNFGRPGPLTPFELLFLFTGNGDSPLAGSPTLPTNWIIEWDRFVDETPEHPDRAARKIDTLLAPPLADMLNEPAGVFKQLAERNLRRGHRLNIPTAQGILAAVNGAGGPYAAGPIEPLSADELTSGGTGPAVGEGGFAEETPLWFYVLKEAEIRGRGEHLGPLGSLIVADTLVGLAVCDPSSFWHQGGSDRGRWHPADGARPDGVVIDSMSAMMAATGQLARQPVMA